MYTKITRHKISLQVLQAVLLNLYLLFDQMHPIRHITRIKKIEGLQVIQESLVNQDFLVGLCLLVYQLFQLHHLFLGHLVAP